MGCCDQPKSKIRRWSWIILLAVVGIVILVVALSDARGQAADNVAAPAITNPMCPVMTDEAIDPEQWVEYEGKRVYFCCRRCTGKFEREPEAYLANLPQFASAASVGHSHAGHSIDAHPEASDGHEHDGAAVPDSRSDEAEHDHAAHDHNAGQSGLAKLVSWLGNFHPPATDFPIALLLSAAIAEMLLIVTGRSMFASAARFCVWLGSLSTIGAAILGWFFAGFRLTDPDWIMTVHRWLGTAAGIWAILVLVLCIAAYRSGERGGAWKPWYRLTLFIGAAAVAANGFFGGAMVYGLDHYAW